MTEQDFWELIKEHIPGEANRVENSADNGMPDVSCCFGIDYWIELKVCSNKEKIRDIVSLLRDDQIVWHLRRGKLGSLIFVIVRYYSRIVIYVWKYEKIKGILLNNISSFYKQIGVIERKKNCFDWQLFKQIIVDTIKERIKSGLCNSGTSR
jgi:hypothetical protein